MTGRCLDIALRDYELTCLDVTIILRRRLEVNVTGRYIYNGPRRLAINVAGRYHDIAWEISN